MEMVKKSWLLLMVILIITGCLQRGLNVKIKYDHINGLEKGNRVIFEGNHIGGVSSVYHTEDGYFLVGISIKKNFINAVTEHSRFSIVQDPENRGDKAIEMIRIRRGGRLLKDGEVVDGVTSSSAFFEKVREGLEKSVDELKKQFEAFSGELKKIPENKEFREFKKELEALPEKIKRAGEEARRKIERDVLPKLKRDMEQLKRKLLEQEKKEDEGLVKT
jgi:hypothetical protein